MNATGTGSSSSSLTPRQNLATWPAVSSTVIARLSKPTLGPCHPLGYFISSLHHEIGGQLGNPSKSIMLLIVRGKWFPSLAIVHAIQ
nr:hypothetical protein CFP56_07847 [Quercus suber]